MSSILKFEKYLAIIFVMVVSMSLSGCERSSSVSEKKEGVDTSFVDLAEKWQLDTNNYNYEIIKHKDGELSNEEKFLIIKSLESQINGIKINKDAKPEIANFEINEKTYTDLGIDTSDFSYSTVSCLKPRKWKMSDLNSGIKKFVHIINKENKFMLKLFGLAEMSFNKRSFVAVIDFAQYRVVKCGKDDIKVGVVARLVLSISNAKRAAELNVPSRIAAASEFKAATVTYTLEILGAANSLLRSEFPKTQGNFDVESYAELISAVDRIMNKLDDNSPINPIVIP